METLDLSLFNNNPNKQNETQTLPQEMQDDSDRRAIEIDKLLGYEPKARGKRYEL